MYDACVELDSRRVSLPISGVDSRGVESHPVIDSGCITGLQPRADFNTLLMPHLGQAARLQNQRSPLQSVASRTGVPRG